jgi:hypothetical protein
MEEKMNRKFIMPLVLFFICLALAATAERPYWPTQNSIPLETNFGFKDVATPTVNITDDSLTSLSDYLPTGTVGFEIRAKNNDFVIGHSDDIATGTDRVGRLVSEGDSYTWNGLGGTFNGVIVANVTSATIVIDAAWGHYEE